MPAPLLREIIPLTQNDCFTIFSRVKEGFDFPLHTHDAFEINLISGAKGAKRIVGDHISDIDDIELVLTGPNLQHGWFTHHCETKEIREITIHFHRDLFDEKLLRRNQLCFIKKLFEKSCRGILFSRETAEAVQPRMAALSQKHGFDSVLELLSIVHDLSISRNITVLSDSCFTSTDTLSYTSRRVEKVMDYLNRNFQKIVTLAEVARLAAMSEVAFSRFFKLRTGKTFIDTLNDIRLGQASRLLIETTNSITEIALKCGFNNISNFNRIFKKRKHCTPKEFRESYSDSGIRNFV